MIKAVKGIIHTQTKVRETKTYTVVNRNDQDRTLIVEHPNRKNEDCLKASWENRVLCEKNFLPDQNPLDRWSKF